MCEHRPDTWWPLWTRPERGRPKRWRRNQIERACSRREIMVFLRDLAIIVATLLSFGGLVRLLVTLAG
jgi:hypothetical protein